MPRPVCVKCQLEFRCVKNGVSAVFMSGNPPQPYQIFDSDKWQCPKCGFEILSGFGREALSDNWMTNFQLYLEKEPKLEVFER